MSRWIWWIRRDLRLHDNPALCHAAARGEVIPLYIHAAGDGGIHAPWDLGGASAWWLHHSLASLDSSLHGVGSRLIVRRGEPSSVLALVAAETGANGIAWNRLEEPGQIALDDAVVDALDGVETLACGDGHLLQDPRTTLTGSGTGYRVFTPFWRALQRGDAPDAPLLPPSLTAPATWPASDPLARLDLLPTLNWADGIDAHWTPGEQGALARLDQFGTIAAAYDEERDRPDVEGTSSLSPHLHFGEVSARQAWWTIRQQGSEASAGWLRQLAWREFSHHLLWHEPHTIDAPLREPFARFPWQRDPARLRAWQRGQTGVPLVDAGMRQLWQTGWMHNRVRMVVASYLVKNLMQPWQEGARWFWDTLVDADLANNTMGWQWTAGCGADAAPYFRIFNPVSQARRFDPDGTYVRRWVPEIAALPDRWLREPWAAPHGVVADAGVTIPGDYPEPLVDLATSRQQALAAYDTIKQPR